jgi:hypothetical protein
VYLQLGRAFIGRKIAALKNLDLEIDRDSLRRWDQPLVGDARKAEQYRTRVGLDIGGMGLLLATLRTPHTHPAARSQGARMVWEVGRRSERRLPVQYIYLNSCNGRGRL